MNRTQALCKAFGWQGGTIHQIAEETGCEAGELLYTDNSPKHHSFGHGYGIALSGRYKHRNWRYIVKNNRGNLMFWLGIADAIIDLDKLAENENIVQSDPNYSYLWEYGVS